MWSAVVMNDIVNFSERRAALHYLAKDSIEHYDKLPKGVPSLERLAECCAEMAQQRAVSYSCSLHEDPYECPDVLVIRAQDGTHGLPVRDGGRSGGRSFVIIQHCPWCGSVL